LPISQPSWLSWTPLRGLYTATYRFHMRVEQCANINPEAFNDLLNINDRNVALAALDRAKVVWVQAGNFSQALLRHALE